MLLLSRRFSVILCLSALLLSACSVRPPKGVLSQSKMEDVLYDYHLAQSLAQQTSTDSLAHYTLRYRQAVYEKYGIDEKRMHVSYKGDTVQPYPTPEQNRCVVITTKK